MTCQVLLFDLDGTLIDSYVDTELCWSEWARAMGVAEFDFAKWFGRRRSEIVRTVLAHPSPAEVARHVEWVRRAERAHTDHVVARPGAARLLRSLPARSWAIVTSNDHEMARLRLRAAGLPLPEVMLGEDDVERGKPDPQGLLLAASLLAASPDATIVVDDSPIGIAAANRAGMRSIGVRFRPGRTEYPGADVVVDGLDQLAVRRAGRTLLVAVHAQRQPRGRG